MLRVLGSSRTLCDGMTRRDLLHAGGLGACGLGLGQFLQAQELRAEPSGDLPSFSRAKNCLLLFLYGSPSQLETFDMKALARVADRLPRPSLRA